jgi:hypothetical protein
MKASDKTESVLRRSCVITRMERVSIVKSYCPLAPLKPQQTATQWDVTGLGTSATGEGAPLYAIGACGCEGLRGA